MELGAVAAVPAAMGGVLKLVLDHLRRMDEKHTLAIEKMQERQEKFLGNHMSGNTRALENVARKLESLAQEVRGERDGREDTVG
jgi:hypothetical protein